MRRVPALSLALLASAACSSDSSRSARFDGNYEGTMVVATQPAATFTLTTTQIGDVTNGRFTKDQASGTFSATLTGAQYSGAIAVAGLNCTTTGSYDDDSFSGTLACGPDGNGTISGARP